MEPLSTLFYKTAPFCGKLGLATPQWIPSSSPRTATLSLSCKFPSGFSKSPLANLKSSLNLSLFARFHAKQRTQFAVYATAATEKSIHDFTVKACSNISEWLGAHIYLLLNLVDHTEARVGLTHDIDGKDVSLSQFKGKVLLIVNVASRCGLTPSNYTELSQLYEKYKPQGFEILAFPCNQFGGQEPGSNSEIKQFACTRFKAEFPIFDKVDVNGPNTAPVYQFLKSSAGGFLGDLVKWNFEKFLIDKNGKVVERYPPTTSPFQIERDIRKLLASA